MPQQNYPLKYVDDDVRLIFSISILLKCNAKEAIITSRYMYLTQRRSKPFPMFEAMILFLNLEHSILKLCWNW